MAEKCMALVIEAIILKPICLQGGRGLAVRREGPRQRRPPLLRGVHRTGDESGESFQVFKTGFSGLIFVYFDRLFCCSGRVDGMHLK